MSLLPRPAWLAMTLALACLHPLDAPARAQTKPNIVFVLADDLEQHGVNAMPRLQQLADVGTTFTRAFVSTPICAPSRATLLTGKYPQNTNTRSNRPPSGGYQNFYTSGQENETFGIWLQRAGYRTALVGKYINFYPASAPALHVPAGWDLWAVPEQTHVHAKFGIKLNENGRHVQYGPGAEDYATDLYARLAAAFINASADARTPFALFLSLNSPHNPFDPAPRHAHLFADARAPRLPSFPEYDTSDKPPFFRLPLLTEPRIAELDDIYARRLRMLRSVDEAIGGLRDLLRQRGLLQDTYFVFSSDNGWHTGHHNQMPMKGRPHEEDIRVPLVVTGPGVPASRQISRLISNADIAPTFAAWGGARVPANVDGRSFAQLIEAPSPDMVAWRNRLPIMRAIEGRQVRSTWPDTTVRPGDGSPYGCFAHLPGPSMLWPEFRGFRSDRYTYVEYETGDVELYDNDTDPYQLNNIACRVAPSLRAGFRQATATLTTCSADICRAAEN